MAITNPFSIQYGDLTVGGSTSYELFGPHVLEKSYSALRLVFDVQVTAEDLATLQSLCDALEEGFRTRLTGGDLLRINLGSAASWTYTQGSTLLAAEASLTKSGDPSRDYGTTRGYTVSISAELPADATADAGLRDLQVLVERTPSRQHLVTMRGLYTSTTAGNARTNYENNFDTVAASYLTAIKSSAAFELVDENQTWDRHRVGTTPDPNLCPFFRQYVELLENQDVGIRDAPEIRDHRFTFTARTGYPGDAGGATRLRRVSGTFECAVDIDETTDLGMVIDDLIVPHVVAEFVSEFEPQQFALESFVSGRDRTGNRVVAQFEFVYQGPGDVLVVEVSTSLEYNETRVIDYTPSHGSGELEMDADPGWVIFTRTWTRSITAVGGFGPRRRLTAPATNRLPDFGGTIGGVDGPDSSGSDLNESGWNKIRNVSSARPWVIGEPGKDQMDITLLTEAVTEQYHEQPGRR